MEKESFMDTAVARVMNDNFICIKVDREERPDIDNIYINACQLLSGNAGWPLNAFALPDGKPFFAGTYYNKQSWINLLKQISQAYKEKNNLVVKQAEALTKGIAEEELSFSGNINKEVVINKKGYQNLFDSIYKKMDSRNGGLKGFQKFPMPALTEFLFQYHYLTGNKEALGAATITLTRMALGGIYDHAGGGFSRYSTDSLWRIPHFEKMLYDNGLLISLYSHAYQLTKNNFYKDILTQTISFVERDLTSPEGGFYCSINADTEDGEGEFYAWNFNDFKKIAGDETGNLIAEYFNVLPEGNLPAGQAGWEKDRNILYALYTPTEFALSKKIVPENFIQILNNSRKALLTERNKRIKPATDTKIITAWNAIMLKGYADAYSATGNQAYLSKALTNAKFLEHNMLDKGGHLSRNFNGGKNSIEAFLDDYAWTAKAFIRLYQVSFDKHWLTLARQVTDYAIANFYDSASGLFYYSAASSQELVVRKMETADNAMPSSCAIMAVVLYELGIYFENNTYSEMSFRMLSVVSGKMKQMAAYYAQWCYLSGIFSYGTYEVAIMGKDANKKNLELQKNYLPSCLYMGETDEENLPLLEAKLHNDKTLIYVCTNKICKLPVEEVDRALKQLK